MTVIDTHVLVWWLAGDRSKITDRARTAIEGALSAGQLVASAISAWEIAMLVAKNRLQLSMDVMDRLDLAGRIEGFHFVPVDVAVAAKSTALPNGFHPDTADRFIVALARDLAAPLITADEQILRYPHVTTIW